MAARSPLSARRSIPLGGCANASHHKRKTGPRFPWSLHCESKLMLSD